MLVAGEVDTEEMVGICSNKFKGAPLAPNSNTPYKGPVAAANEPFADPLPFKGIEDVY